MLDASHLGIVELTVFDKVEMTVVLLSIDIQPFIFFGKIDSEMVKERDSEIIAGLAWTGWIESESRPYVPDRETTIILVDRIGFPTWVKSFLTESLDEKGSVVRVIAVTEEIG